MRKLCEQPLKLEKAGIINRAVFYKLFNDNMEKIIDLKESSLEIKAKAARDNISLCRAAINYFVVKDETKAFYEIVDYYKPWSTLIPKTAIADALRKHNDAKDMQRYDILYLPEEDEVNVRKMLKEITSSVKLEKSVKANWNEFRETGKWQGGIVIGDGAMGTELMKHKLQTAIAARWNKKRADIIQKIHEANVEAGAQVILTNTFDANRGALKQSFSSESEYTQFLKELDSEDTQVVKELNRTGVEIAHRACGGADILIFGRIGPSWREWHLFDPNGHESDIKKELELAFREQAEALSKAGVDGIWIEGMACLKEAIIAVEAASENTDVPVICTMQFEEFEVAAHDFRGSGFRTVTWHNSLPDVISKLKEAGTKAIGANCGNVVEDMPYLTLEMRKKTELPLMFRINVEQHPEYFSKDDTYKVAYRRSPEDFAEIMSQVAAAGGNIIGGCCGATPEHIAAFRNRLGQSVEGKAV